MLNIVKKTRLFVCIAVCFFFFTSGSSENLLSVSERSGVIQSQQESPVQISFETVDAKAYWSWLDPGTQPDENLNHVMVVSDPDEVEALIEQLHEAEQELAGAEESMKEMEWLEYNFFTHLYLSALYRRNADEADNDQLNVIIQHKETAISYLDELIEKDESYRTDRAFPELELTMLLCWENAGRDCFDRLYNMLDKYDHTPYGAYPEYFSTNFTLPGMAHYFSDNEEEILHQTYIKVLEELAKQTDLLGVSARLHLVREYLKSRDLERARHILHDISALNQDADGLVRGLPDDLQRFFERMDNLYHHLQEMDEETPHDHEQAGDKLLCEIGAPCDCF